MMLVVSSRERSIIASSDVAACFGDGEGEVPLRGLEKHFLKLPHNIKPKVVNELDRKFTAMGGAAMPIPKGPVPRGGRVPRR